MLERSHVRPTMIAYFVSISVWAVIPNLSHSAIPSRDGDSEAAAVVQAFLGCLDGVRKGSCDIKETSTRTGLTSQIKYTFDFDKELIRCDTTVSGATLRVLTTSSDMLFYVAGEKIARRLRPTASVPLAKGRPFELRHLNIIGLGDYVRRTPLPRTNRQDATMRVLSVSRSREDNNKWTITRYYDQQIEQKNGPTVFDRIYMVTEVDASLGYSPTASSWYEQLDYKPLPAAVERVGRLRQTAAYTFAKVNDCFVPTKIAYRGGEGDESSKIDVDMTWTAVQDNVDLSQFSEETFDFAPTANIYNEVRGERFLERTIPAEAQ